MKTIPTDLQAHLELTSTTLSLLWRITRSDNVVMGFTSHDRDIVYNNTTYKASTSFDSSTFESSVGMQVDNLNIASILNSDDITDDDLRRGVYDSARVDIYLINFSSPQDGVAHLFRGFLGETKLTKLGYNAEILGLTSKLETKIGQLYSPLCRVNLGSDACKVATSSFTETGQVTSVISRQKFSDSSNTGQEDDWFSQGLITFTSGDNDGKSYEVKSYIQSSGTIELYVAADFDVSVGDSYSIVAGCDKKFTTCQTKFNNAKNFQGEPHVPGNDFLIEPANRST